MAMLRLLKQQTKLIDEKIKFLDFANKNPNMDVGN